MTRIHRLVVLLGLVVAIAGTAACATSIRKVLNDPSRYRDREVTISGHVLDSYSVAGNGVYHVEDETGSLWVASQHGVPRKGAYVKTRGTIREGFNLGALGNIVKLPSGGVVLIEREHRVRF
jgi:hypothetical protein